ncbi:cyclin-like protein [Ascodesmis nigricans]|uniref:RNA polymerase II holoenzyme cyclin-like subunit n=1 Tax=Ascodesmis nigricans TaxID=341454 RepID=A0A4S2N2J0_9PEZI|nr:cyclin-like protein [Ascodesmis nigricans]
MSASISSEPAWDSQWLFTEEELKRTPSNLDGITPQQEREMRSKGCNFITQLGIQLQLPQLTLATASMYLHRFYMQNSLKRYHYYEIAATALFLATKVEENMRKFTEIVAACVRAAQKNLSLQVHRDDKEFWRWKDCILSKEEFLLESLCFDLSVEVPYNHLLAYTEQLGKQTRTLIRTAWAFLNDAQLTMLCLMYPPKTIATAALYWAAGRCEEKFPDQDGKPWWEVLGVKIVDIKRCCNHMAMVYANNPLCGDSQPKYAYTPEGETDKTRARAASETSPLPPEKRVRQSSNNDQDEYLERKRIKLEDRNGASSYSNQNNHRHRSNNYPSNNNHPPPSSRHDDTEKEEGEATDIEEGEVDD